MLQWYPDSRKRYRNVYYYGTPSKRYKSISQNLDVKGIIKRLKNGYWHWIVYCTNYDLFGVLPTKKLAFREVENIIERNEILGEENTYGSRFTLPL